MKPPKTTPRKKPFAANKASTDKLTAEGWTVCTVEQRIPHCFITRDAFGFFDLLAASPTRGIMAVQVTGGNNMASRVHKVKAEPRAAIWLAAGGRIQVHCHVKKKGVVGRFCKVLEITPQSINETERLT